MVLLLVTFKLFILEFLKWTLPSLNWLEPLFQIGVRQKQNRMANSVDPDETALLAKHFFIYRAKKVKHSLGKCSRQNIDDYSEFLQILRFNIS